MKCFVVVGMPRTGSTLLSTGLAQHQHARCFGELFHPVENERAHAHALNIDGRRVSFNPLKDDAVEFLNEYVFSDRNADVTTVGFKLFGEYVKGPGSEGLFRQLREKFPQLHVIHIFRRNYLEVLLSRETAAATKQWVVFASGNEEIKGGGPITIDPVVAQRFFENMQRMDHFYESYFGGDRYFKAGYEELDNDFQGTMTRAYAFLGLPPQEVKPQTIKQRTKSLRERIVNYDALALTFKDTGFADFFFESGSTDRTEPAAPFQAGVMHPALGPRILDGGLRTLIDEANEIARTEADLNVALAGIPLDLFALMQLYRGRLPEPLRGRIPPLPTPSEQVTWAGDSGLPLMLRTSDYTKLMVNRYLRSRTKRLSEVYFLDYGCGWGRIMRFMAALIPTSHIFGVDPMQASLDICGRDRVAGRVSLCDQLPRGGIELGRKFDLINCFSVFSHLAEDAHLVVLEAIRGLVTENGLVFISLRTRGYWEQMHAQFGTAVAEKLKDHDERGFAFAPGKSGQNLQEHYGDSSTSLEYVRRNWTRWNVEAVEFSHHQPNQIFLCLSPRL